MDEAIELVTSEVPEYGLPLEGQFGRGLRYGVEQAIGQFVEALDSGSPRVLDREVYRRLGIGEFRSGRTLDALQGGYLIGAQLVWRRCSAVVADAGFDHDTLIWLAEAIFAYAHDVTNATAEGYAQAMTEAITDRERRMRRVVALLLDEEAPEREALETSAARAGWPLPGSLACVVAEPGEAERCQRRLGDLAVVAPVEQVGCVIVREPSRRASRSAVQRAFAGTRSAIGPVVDWRDARTSFRRASLAFRLQTEGALPSGLIDTEDHLGTLLLRQDDDLTRALAARRLAPLAGLPAGSRQRLIETLRTWLDRHGSVSATAAALYVHPQTVRYRVARLRELFGDALDDPAARTEIELALRADPAP